MNEELQAALDQAKEVAGDPWATRNERRLAEAVLILIHYVASLRDRNGEPS